MPHASQQDPCPWIGLLTLLADPILPDPRFLLLFPVATNNKVLFQLLNVLAGDRVLFTHNRRYYNVLQGWDGCGPFLSEGLRCITWNTLGPCWICFLQTKEQRVQTQLSKKTLGPQQHHLSPGVHGKDEFLQAIQVLAPRFRLFGTFLPDNENAGGSAICIHRDLLPEDAIVTHVVTCQGRDHLVNIRSGRHSLVIVNVHFEPEPTLRQLRGRLVLFTHTGLHIPVVWFFLGDFNICDLEEGRFNVWNQTFTDGDPGKTAVFHSFFPYVLEVAQSDYTRRDATALGVIRTLSRIDRILSIYLWLRHVISIALLMLLRTFGRKLFRVTMLQYASSSRNLQIDDTRANVFPVGCPNIPFLILSCSNFMTTTVSLLTHFVHWPNFKFSYIKPRRLRNESYRSKHLTASGQSF